MFLAVDRTFLTFHPCR